jgi:hypothetical protein
MAISIEFQIINQNGEIQVIDLEQIQQLIKDGHIYTSDHYEWYGTCSMFMNRFSTLFIKATNQNGEEKYYDIEAVWKSKDEDQQDRMEECDEHIMLDNFDTGYNFFG